MTDYNTSYHGSEREPTWLKSLVGSLDRRHGASTVLPLAVIVDEIIEWVELASGTDAWKKPANRTSIQRDLNQSVDAFGPTLRSSVARELGAFQAAFTKLIDSPPATFSQPPGTRADLVWVNVLREARTLLTALTSDEAARTSWDDLLVVAQDPSLDRRQYRPIAELLFQQLQRRGINAEQIFRDLASIVAYGRDPDNIPAGVKDTPLNERLANARVYIGTPATTEPIVVWLGYQGRLHSQLSAGRVTFMDAHWAVPNTEPDGQRFKHREELSELVRAGLIFRVARMVDEESEVDFLVRVDLGITTDADAITRATDMVNTILNVAIHNAGGVRPHLAQYAILRSGKPRSFSIGVSRRDAGYPDDDHYGAGVTSDAIEQHAPRIAEALAREELPRFLAAAIEVQVTADRPFSREMAMRKPSEADISSVIPLSDRVVQYIAAHAAMDHCPKHLVG